MNLKLSRFPLQTKHCLSQFATGGSPGVIQRRGVGRRNGEMHKDGLPGRLTLPRNPGLPGWPTLPEIWNPGISRFMLFICVHLCHLWIKIPPFS